MKKIYDFIPEQYKNKMQLITLKKNQTLFHEGEKCHQIGFVLKGEIVILSFQENGKEIIYNILSKDQVFGNNLIFSSQPFYRGDVVCQEDAVIGLMEKEDLMSLLKESDDFLLTYLNLQSDFGKDLNLRIKLLTFNLAEDRILFLLKSHNGKYRYKTITELARYFNLTREVLSRKLHELEKNNVIIIRDKIIEKL